MILTTDAPATSSTPSRPAPPAPLSSAFLTSLDSPETNVHTDPPATTYATRRHAPYATDRRHALHVLRTAPVVGPRRLRRFQDCRRGAWLWYNKHTGQARVTSFHCRDQLCPTCQATRRAQVTDHVLSFLKPRHFDHPLKLLTLTLAHNPTPLAEQLARLKTCFKRLRTRRLWRDRIHGGMWFLHLKLDADSDFWHPHLHVICDGSYLPIDEIADAWHFITDDSYICHIEAMHTDDRVARYVARYVASPGPVATYPLPKAHQALDALAHGKTFAPFGSWRSALSLKTEPPPLIGWQPIASMDRICRLAASGDPEALHLLTVLGGSIHDPSTKPRSPPAAGP